MSDPKPTFQTAKIFKLTFGKYAGQTLDEIAVTDAGLKYLDWLRGEVKTPRTRTMLSLYLDDPTISQDLINAMAKEED